MKVIIQDLETYQYLAGADGWVSAADSAQDFLTILRAYNFARRNTSGRFKVVLYCPDDGYCTSIIDGEGTAVSAGKSICTPMLMAAPTAPLKIGIQVWAHPAVQIPVHFHPTRNYLN